MTEDSTKLGLYSFQINAENEQITFTLIDADQKKYHVTWHETNLRVYTRHIQADMARYHANRLGLDPDKVFQVIRATKLAGSWPS